MLKATTGKQEVSNRKLKVSGRKPKASGRKAKGRKEASASQMLSIELRTLATDLAHQLTTHVPSAALTEAYGTVGRAVGVIVVSPVFNASYSGLFKMFFDLMDEGVMAGRPVLLAATGGSARHSLVIATAPPCGRQLLITS